MIYVKALWRAVIFDMGRRMIKLTGGRIAAFDWKMFWWLPFEDRYGYQITYLKHSEAKYKGWMGKPMKTRPIRPEE